MKKENSAQLIRRVAVRALFLTGLTLVPIGFFTKNPLYCIIFMIGSGISFFGYFLMIRVVDRVMGKKSGKCLFFTSGLGKMILITAVFILVSKYPEPAVLFYMLGLSMIILSVIIEGGSQVFRGLGNGS